MARGRSDEFHIGGCGTFDAAPRDASINGEKGGFVVDGSGQKECVGDLIGALEPRDIKAGCVQDVWLGVEELMVGMSEEFEQALCNLRDRHATGQPGQHAQCAGTGQGATRPASFANGGEPVVGYIVVEMGGIKQGDQHVDVDKRGLHDSSRRRLT